MRPIEIQPTRLTRVTDKVAASSPAQPAAAIANGEKDVEVKRSELLSQNQPPVDAERVAQVRQAIAEGVYPLVPAKIADAMIAASMLLRSPQ